MTCLANRRCLYVGSASSCCGPQWWPMAASLRNIRTTCLVTLLIRLPKRAEGRKVKKEQTLGVVEAKPLKGIWCRCRHRHGGMELVAPRLLAAASDCLLLGHHTQMRLSLFERREARGRRRHAIGAHDPAGKTGREESQRCSNLGGTYQVRGESVC